MDFDFTDEQQLLVSSLQSLFHPYREIPAQGRGSTSYFAADLQRKLVQGGFFDTARLAGNLEAALVVLEAGRLPVAVEAGASALVAPNLMESPPEGPIAVLSGDLAKAHRMLAVARTALIDVGDEAVVLPIEAGAVEPVETMLAAPYGRFREPPDLARGRRLGAGSGDRLRQWSRVALAAESAGAAESALAFTLDYVRQRKAFGQAIGSFQAVQHRLAQCHQIVRALRFNALHAAWTGEAVRADLAWTYAQMHIQKLVFDLHQFNGAIGLTAEYKLHYWTFRLRALQPEAGGGDAAALAVADKLWGTAA
jgi:hypothetical protein